jgi:hypothetical protein
MKRFYVSIAGVSQSFLDFLGYFSLFEDEEFRILMHKDDLHFVDKNKPYLYVDDVNDAALLNGPFMAREKIRLPPKAALKTEYNSC